MPVLKDYKCPTHGYFESYEPNCRVEGCSEEVLAVFLQAPGLVSDTTKKNDKRVKQLAIDFGMSNVKSTREGENQTGYFTRKNENKNIQVQSQSVPQKESRPGDAAIWGGGFKGLNMQSVLSGRAIRPVADESVGINPKSAGNLTGPRAASYTADHENLSIKK
jgi:hypothetical protein